jgi:hypothetical protein
MYFDGTLLDMTPELFSLLCVARNWQLVDSANFWGGSCTYYEAEEVCLATKYVNST